jgi:hypothetical protein
MSKFIAVFPNISPEWLITGKGEMIKNVVKTNDIVNNNNNNNNKEQSGTCSSCEDKKEIIEAQKETIEAQKETIEAQKETIFFLRNKSESISTKKPACTKPTNTVSSGYK